VLWLQDPYDLIRSRQIELREAAARAQLLAAAGRQADQARRERPGRFSRAARRLRATLARP
jgi:hypothetical protein